MLFQLRMYWTAKLCTPELSNCSTCFISCAHKAGSCASDYRQQMEQSRKGQAFDCPALTAATRQGDSRDEVGRLPGGAPQLSNQPARQKHVPGCSKMTRPWLPSRTLLNPHQVVVLAENVRGKALD
jgi:hypothetical protein